MNRMTQKKILIELKEIYSLINPRSTVIEKNLIERLQTIEEIFKNELSSVRSAAYNEMLDGVILAFDQLIKNPNSNDRQQSLSLCKDLLKYVFFEFRGEKEVKKDILFLPYKASMWDALESIWLAAVEDKDHCNAYVMPIPYADRKPDQTVAAWHCEADQFPKYVPVLDWAKVNLEEWHPDIIFIHNPYDNRNAVTSVDSHYYSDKLKNYTDKLIYVPYFVTKDIIPGDYDAEENIAHLITTEGVLNADLVVVQSENIRQAYINVLSRHTNQGQEYWQKHIVGLGSPKYDKIKFTDQSDLEIPKSWLKVIQKPDKTFKKIIFFNTGLTPMLKHKEKLINKIEFDLKIFKEYSDQIALLWRPHPLISATLGGMLPELQERYDKILQSYKRENWGILDDTADLTRAMVLSDAYFGDGSSVELLYSSTGKPIMNHNVFIDDKNIEYDYRLFKFNNAIYEDNEIFCTAFYDRNLYKIDLETKKIELFTQILDDNEELTAFIHILTYKNYFIFIQSTTIKLIVMDRKTHHKEKFQIPAAINKNLRFAQKFVNTFLNDDELYIFGFHYSGIVKFNLSTKKFFVIDDFLNEVINKFKIPKEQIYLYSYALIDNKLYLPITNHNVILELSLIDNATQIHYVGDDKQKHRLITDDGQNIWIMPLNGSTGNIIKWNPQTNYIKTFEKFTNESVIIDFLSNKMIKTENYILIMSFYGKKNILINLETDEITIQEHDQKLKIFLNDRFSCLHSSGDEVYFFNEMNFYKYLVNENTFETIELTPSENILEYCKQIESEKLKFIFKARFDGTSTQLLERTKLNLKHFLKFIRST